MHPKFATPQNFYRRNKDKILITIAVTATTAAVLMRLGIKQHNDFLKENDLYDKFYDQID